MVSRVHHVKTLYRVATYVLVAYGLTLPFLVEGCQVEPCPARNEPEAVRAIPTGNELGEGRRGIIGG